MNKYFFLCIALLFSVYSCEQKTGVEGTGNNNNRIVIGDNSTIVEKQIIGVGGFGEIKENNFKEIGRKFLKKENPNFKIFWEKIIKRPGYKNILALVIASKDVDDYTQKFQVIKFNEEKGIYEIIHETEYNGHPYIMSVGFELEEDIIFFGGEAPRSGGGSWGVIFYDIQSNKGFLAYKDFDEKYHFLNGYPKDYQLLYQYEEIILNRNNESNKFQATINFPKKRQVPVQDLYENLPFEAAPFSNPLNIIGSKLPNIEEASLFSINIDKDEKSEIFVIANDMSALFIINNGLIETRPITVYEGGFVNVFFYSNKLFLLAFDGGNGGFHFVNVYDISSGDMSYPISEGYELDDYDKLIKEFNIYGSPISE